MLSEEKSVPVRPASWNKLEYEHISIECKNRHERLNSIHVYWQIEIRQFSGQIEKWTKIQTMVHRALLRKQKIE